MASVVNLTQITTRFATLGWENLSTADVADFVTTNNVPGTSLIAYLDALIAAPTGLNDATITGCTAANATKITNALKSKGMVIV